MSMRLINPLARIGGRIFIAFSVLVVTLTLALGFMGLKFAQENIHANAANELRVLSVTLARMVQYRLARLEASLAALDDERMIFRELQSRKPESAKIEAFLRQRLSTLPIYQALALFNRDGICVASTSPGLCAVTGKQQTFFVEGLKGANFSEVVTMDEGKIQLISTPLARADSIRGVLVGEVNLSSIYDMMDQKLGLSENTDAFLVDASLSFITPDKMATGHLSENHLLATKLSKHLHEDFWVDRYQNFAGATVLGTAMKIPGRPLYIVVERDTEEVNRPVRAVKQVITVTTFALICALIITTFFLTRSITKPLMKLVASTKRIADGDLSQVVAIPHGSDEVRFLAAEIETMRARIAAFQESMIVRLEESERKRIENERLAAIGTMASTLAHEIRNPLNAMALLLARLELAGGASHIVNGTVQGLRGEICRLDRLVTDILDYAKPVDLALAKVDLVDLVHETLLIYRGAIDAKQLRCDAHFAAAKMIVCGDADRLKQCLVNIVQNAIDSLDVGGRFEMHTSYLADGRVQLSVLDEGIGLEPESEKRLFDLFFTTKARGTGLGLATVKKILDAHGASIVVERRSHARELAHRAAAGTAVHIVWSMPRAATAALEGEKLRS